MKEWFKRLQHICRYIGLTDAEKVACAVNQLNKEAMCLWEVVGQTEDHHAMTWEHFTRLFREKYLGEARLSGKVREFLSIRQGKMSVVEYVAKFDKLARFAPTIVPTNDAHKMKFMHRLCLKVAKQIDSGKEGPESYADAIQRAIRNDRCDRPDDKSVETQTARQG